jgi:glycosyltransferase involved in cell wall biosynthesis
MDLASNEELVSIIVPLYKSEKFVRAGIENLLAQTYSNTEIIVVYDESPDNTLGILKDYEDKIQLIVQGKTSPARARNVGISHAKGKYISFFDIDDYINKDKIKIQVELLQNNLDIGLTYTDFEVVFAGKNKSKIIICPEWDRRRWLKKQFIAFSSITVKKKQLDELYKLYGYYFDCSLPAYDDFDFLIRLSALTEFKRIPHLLMQYTVHKSNLSRNLMKMLLLRSKILYKNGLYRYWIKSIFDIPTMYAQGLLCEYL